MESEKQKQKYKLIDTEKRLVVARGTGRVGGRNGCTSLGFSLNKLKKIINHEITLTFPIQI